MFWHVFGRLLALLSSGSLKTCPQPRWQSWVFSMITWWPWIVFPWWPSCLGCRWPKIGLTRTCTTQTFTACALGNAKPVSQRIFANAPEIVVLLRRVSDLFRVFGGLVPQPLLAFPALCTRGTLWLWSSYCHTRDKHLALWNNLPFWTKLSQKCLFMLLPNGTEWGNICYINSYGIIYKHNIHMYIYIDKYNMS